MGTIKEIVKAIDDELIKKDKYYLLLGQANNLLLNNNLLPITDKNNNTLKQLLQQNKIPHAFQTEEKPKQWRIPLSPNGTKRKEKIIKENSIKSKKSLPAKEYEKSIYENSIKPETSIPIKESPLKDKTLIIIGTVLFAFWLIFSNNNDNNTSKANVKNNYLDSSVHQVESYLRNYLNDPKSYEGIEWSKVNETKNNDNYKYWVRHKFRAKNSLGGYVIENKIFYLDKNGNVINEIDVY